MNMRNHIYDIQAQVSEMLSLTVITDDIASEISFEHLSSAEQATTTHMQNLMRLAVRQARELEKMVNALSAEVHGDQS
ncbi:hypothetical protein [Neorhizobium sp. DAR64860/K0K1]|uniref:hypothetical protein n=1 Tax=Neorhizobium sp. DAR64860/K0K1 TaxID=3421955 RepID=UPI003D2B6D3C